jgi:hypothetical protein
VAGILKKTNSSHIWNAPGVLESWIADF